MGAEWASVEYMNVNINYFSTLNGTGVLTQCSVEYMNVNSKLTFLNSEWERSAQV